MTDIVERLRARHRDDATLEEAADAIERLRDAVTRGAAHPAFHLMVSDIENEAGAEAFQGLLPLELVARYEVRCEGEELLTRTITGRVRRSPSVLN